MAKKLRFDKGKKKNAPIVPAPKNRALPGMEHVRYKELDGVCESLGDVREKKNRLQENEDDLKTAGLRYLQKHNLIVYRHGGIELVRVPGSDKLSVKLAKDKDDTDVKAGDEGEGGGDE